MLFCIRSNPEEALSHYQAVVDVLSRIPEGKRDGMSVMHLEDASDYIGKHQQKSKSDKQTGYTAAHFKPKADAASQSPVSEEKAQESTIKTPGK